MATATMDADLARKLDRLKNYRTRYELVAEGPFGRILVLYSDRNNQRGLLEAVCKNGEAFAKVTGGETITIGKRHGMPATCPNGVKVFWSGRTQREAYIEGPLPFLLDLYEQRQEEEVR